jgi:hypothetical protein
MKFATIVKRTTMFCTCALVVTGLATDFAFAQAPPLTIEPGTSRYTAVHECSIEVEKWSDRDWETTKAARYGACRINHGQVQ